MAYIGAATSLVTQGELRVPTGEWNRPDSTSALSLWPPGYPALIAVPVGLGASPVQSARYINTVAAGVLAATVVMLVSGAVGTAGGVVAAMVVFASQAIFDVHLSVLSEPLFLALIALTLAVMAVARDRLLLLGLLAAATVMVRYAGAAVPAAVVTWTLIDPRYNVRSRFRRGALVAVLSVIVIVAWVARTALVRDRHGTPELAVYGGWSATLQQARDTVLAWLAPGIPEGLLQRAVAAAALIVLAGFIIATVRDTAGSRGKQRHQDRVTTLIAAASVLAGWYVVVLLASRSFVGGTIPFDGRILAPLILLAEVAAVTSIGYWWHAYHRPMHVIVGVIGAAWLAAAATVTVNDATYAATEGSDFASTDWRDSPLVAWVRVHGNGHTLYSNWPPALYFNAGRVARKFPDSSKSDDMAGFARALRLNGGYVVGFTTRSPDVIAPSQLAQRLSLHEVARTEDGTVWDAREDTTVGGATTTAKLRQ